MMSRSLVQLAFVAAAVSGLKPLQRPAVAQSVAKAAANAALAVSLLGAPVAALTAPLPAFADRGSKAPTSAGSRVNKDQFSLLRNGLPIGGKLGSATRKADVRKVQLAVEAVKDDLRSKRIRAALGDTQNARGLLKASSGAIAASAPARYRADVEKALAECDAALAPIAARLADSGSAGSPQERDSLDAAGKFQAEAASRISFVEARLVPENYRAPAAPAPFDKVPRLEQRARVEMVIKKGEAGGKFAVDGVFYDRARLEMIVDGYTAPLTAGNYVDLVEKGFYTGMAIQRSDGFVVQTGDPDGPDGPLVGYGQNGDAKAEPRRVPLEIFVDGDDAPTYSETTEDGLRGASQTILPFQAYGALGMARDEYEADTASSQYFWLLFDSDLTPAGKNLLDGRYACFGYTVKGEDFLTVIEEGDVIESAKVLAKGVDP